MSQKVPATAALPHPGAASLQTARNRVRTALAGRRGRVSIAVLLALAFAMHWAVIVARRGTQPGDFDLSRELGRRFIAGEPLYAGGLHYPYLPAAAAAFAPLALFDPVAAFTLRYAVALGCLWLTLRLLNGLCQAGFAAHPADSLPVAAITLLLGAHYVLRDLDDAGPHLILLFVLVAGAAAVAHGRATVGAMCFGFAAALKLPCALLIPFFFWSRRARLARTTMLALAFWVSVPLLWMGPRSWVSHHVEWARTVLASAAGTPLPGAGESELRPQNQALRPLVVRLTGGSTAVANLTALALLVLVGSSLEPAPFRRRCVRTGGAEAPGAEKEIAAAFHGSWVAEVSAVLILSLLLSPVTWVQHLVLMLPALYLLVATVQASRPLRVGVRVAAVAYVFAALVLNRELVGRTLYLELLNTGLHTACMLLVLGMVVWWRPSATAAA